MEVRSTTDLERYFSPKFVPMHSNPSEYIRNFNELQSQRGYGPPVNNIGPSITALNEELEESLNVFQKMNEELGSIELKDQYGTNAKSLDFATSQPESDPLFFNDETIIKEFQKQGAPVSSPVKTQPMELLPKEESVEPQGIEPQREEVAFKPFSMAKKSRPRLFDFVPSDSETEGSDQGQGAHNRVSVEEMIDAPTTEMKKGDSDTVPIDGPPTPTPYQEYVDEMDLLDPISFKMEIEKEVVPEPTKPSAPEPVVERSINEEKRKRKEERGIRRLALQQEKARRAKEKEAKENEARKNESKKNESKEKERQVINLEEPKKPAEKVNGEVKPSVKPKVEILVKPETKVKTESTPPVKEIQTPKKVSDPKIEKTETRKMEIETLPPKPKEEVAPKAQELDIVIRQRPRNFSSKKESSIDANTPHQPKLVQGLITSHVVRSQTPPIIEPRKDVKEVIQVEEEVVIRGPRSFDRRKEPVKLSVEVETPPVKKTEPVAIVQVVKPIQSGKSDKPIPPKTQDVIVAKKEEPKKEEAKKEEPKKEEPKKEEALVKVVSSKRTPAKTSAKVDPVKVESVKVDVGNPTQDSNPLSEPFVSLFRIRLQDEDVDWFLRASTQKAIEAVLPDRPKLAQLVEQFKRLADTVEDLGVDSEGDEIDEEFNVEEEDLEFVQDFVGEDTPDEDWVEQPKKSEDSDEEDKKYEYADVSEGEDEEEEIKQETKQKIKPEKDIAGYFNKEPKIKGEKQNLKQNKPKEPESDESESESEEEEGEEDEMLRQKDLEMHQQWLVDLLISPLEEINKRTDNSLIPAIKESIEIIQEKVNSKSKRQTVIKFDENIVSALLINFVNIVYRSVAELTTTKVKGVVYSVASLRGKEEGDRILEEYKKKVCETYMFREEIEKIYSDAGHHLISLCKELPGEPLHPFTAVFGTMPKAVLLEYESVVIEKGQTAYCYVGGDIIQPGKKAFIVAILHTKTGVNSAALVPFCFYVAQPDNFPNVRLDVILIHFTYMRFQFYMAQRIESKKGDFKFGKTASPFEKVMAYINHESLLVDMITKYVLLDNLVNSRLFAK